MKRHYYLCTLEWSDELIEELKEFGYIEEEYEYTNVKKAGCFKVFRVRDGGKDIGMALSTNFGTSYTYHYHKMRNKYKKTRDMLLLNSEGEKYLKKIIVKQQLSR